MRDDHGASRPWWTYHIASRLAGTKEASKVMEVLNYFGNPEKRLQTIDRSTIFGDLPLAKLLYNYINVNPHILEGADPFVEFMKTLNFSAQGFV